MRPNQKTWNNHTEAAAVRSAEAMVGQNELFEKYATQAHIFAQQHPMKVKTFISAGHRDIILKAKDKMNAAKFIARNEPHYLSDTLPEGDINHQAAFLIALSFELEKSEYKQ